MNRTSVLDLRLALTYDGPEACARLAVDCHHGTFLFFIEALRRERPTAAVAVLHLLKLLRIERARLTRTATRQAELSFISSINDAYKHVPLSDEEIADLEKPPWDE